MYKYISLYLNITILVFKKLKINHNTNKYSCN
jgi:hypothetical protein